MAEAELLAKMIQSFRVTELNALLTFANKKRTGIKSVLQDRALELISLKSPEINAKIRELFQIVAPNSSGVLDTSDSSSGSSRPSSSASDSTSSEAETPLRFRVSLSSKRDISRSVDLGSTVPILPDVKFKKLPFYDILGELLRPSSLVPQGSNLNEANFSFHLTPQQVSSISSSRNTHTGQKYQTQILIRFSLLETSCEQDDFFPPGLVLKVNSKSVALPNPLPLTKPGLVPQRPPGPVDITSYCRLSPTISNSINATWTSDMQGRRYAVGVFLVNRLSSADLLTRLKNKGLRPSEYTRGLIKEKLVEDADLEIATTTLRVSLACPLGKMRMSLPCRSTTCTHLQCFDATLFLQMNERKPKWNCPVCDRSINYDTLAIDGYFSEILSSKLLPAESLEVQLNVDGSWSILGAKKIVEVLASPAAVKDPEVCTVDEDDLEEFTASPPKKSNTSFIDLVSSSSEDELEETAATSRTKKLSLRDYYAKKPYGFRQPYSSSFAPLYPTYHPQDTNLSGINLHIDEPTGSTLREEAEITVDRASSSSPEIIALD